MRTNGILMAISSLPSKHGIGDFGPSAYEFIDLLKKAKIRVWQVLPLNPVGYGNSPYQSECGEAIDPIYISLDMLKEDGYLGEVKCLNKKSSVVDYENVRLFKMKYLKEAFKKSKDLSKKEYKEFCANNYWLDNYAKFHCLFLKNNYKEWNKWEKMERLDPYFHEVNYKAFKEEINFLKWCQYIAFKQYLALKAYAKANEVLIMGDIPFYVGGMSSDVWGDQDEFLLDDNDQFTYIAGVPPDYFSKTGQRWGNPIYDWNELKSENYAFWMKRFSEATKLYDILRIDHFRAFDTYWKIPASCDTAVVGTWEKGPGKDLFIEMKKNKIDIQIVAEDLGDLFPSVIELRDLFDFPGMYVLEFNFLNKDATILKNSIIYTGTHDNDTLKSWYENLSIEEQNQIRLKMSILKVSGNDIVDKFLNYSYNSIADIAITPMQDFLKLGKEARMNLPGTCNELNWTFRLVDYSTFKKAIPSILKRNTESKRI